MKYVDEDVEMSVNANINGVPSVVLDKGGIFIVVSYYIWRLN